MGRAKMTKKSLRSGKVGTRPLVFTCAVVLLLVASGAYVGEDSTVEAMPPRYGQVDSKIYLSSDAGSSPQPLLVLLGGAEGGNSWATDAWRDQREIFLAQGYALLAVGYFGLPNTPKKLDRIALEGVHSAILEAARDSRINADCIGLIGGSRGGELALLLGSYYSDIGAVVALVPGSAVFPSLTLAMRTPGFAFERQALKFVPMKWNALPDMLRGNVGAVMRVMAADDAAMESAAIPVENINGPVLLVSATEDEMWPSTDMSQKIMSRLERHNFQPVHEHWAISGGHSEPLDEFPRIEAFLDRHFAPNREFGGCG